MEARLKEALWDGEEVRWTGKPKPFALLGSDCKTEFLITWVISAAILLTVLCFIVSQLISGARSLMDILVMSAVILFVPAILSIRPFLDKKCLEQKSFYAVTNYRVITMVKDEILFMSIDKNLKAAVEQEENGCGNLCFGEAIGKSPRKSRALAVVGLRGGEARQLTEGLMFYHVEQPEQIMAQLTCLDRIA